MGQKYTEFFLPVLFRKKLCSLTLIFWARHVTKNGNTFSKFVTNVRKIINVMFDDYSSSAIKFCSESSPGGNQVDGLPPGPNNSELLGR